MKNNIYKQYRVCAALLILAGAVTLVSCSNPQTGPQWQCLPFGDDVPESERQTQCNVQVTGEELKMRLAKKKDKWFLLVSHPKGGQVKGQVTIEPRWGDVIELSAHANQKQCNPNDCIFPLDEKAFKAIQKSNAIKVNLRRTSIRRQMVKSQDFEELFTGRDLNKALKQAEK